MTWKQTNHTNLILNAYYETLYEQLLTRRGLFEQAIEELLQEELGRLGFEDFDREKFASYRQASLAFVDERLEMYNPVGIQYTFDRIRAREAAELELQLNWYDSRAEFEDLMSAVRQKAESPITGQKLYQLAGQLIQEFGAFPDRSIISAYKAEPALNKLPDYVVAQVIERTIR
ncbi:MAG: hypothetical protein JXB29_07200 [Sedimentisphaerales bacterium]|nr:hypothetical protein [Sedimentisphaerales bacterium]